MKILFTVLDGLGDRPVKSLGGTPLESADTPNLDNLAKGGETGLIAPQFEGDFPTSKEGHLGLFGFNPTDDDLRRGVFEVLGAGMELKEGDVAFRGNFATVDKNLKIIDRRAGRISDTSSLVEKINGMEVKGIKIIIKPGVSHRAGVILRGEGLSHHVSDGDLHKEGIKAPKMKPTDKSKEAEFTALILNKFLDKIHEVLESHSFNKKRKEKDLLPANFILLRGAGRLKNMESFEEKWGISASCVAGGTLYKGIGKALGMDFLEVEGATGKHDTDLEGKFEKALSSLGKYDFSFLHIKATDNFSHDGDCLGKKRFIEKIDDQFSSVGDVLTIVTGDHCTSCEKKEHIGDPIPVLVSGRGKDETSKFGEKYCKKGGLGKIKSTEFLEKTIF